MDRSSAEPSTSQPSSPNPYTSTPNKFKSAESSQVQQSVIDRVHSNETQPQLDCQGQSNGDSASFSPAIMHGVASPGFMVARKESYKLQRKNYRFEKKKAANELLGSFKDPAVVVLADWLKGKPSFLVKLIFPPRQLLIPTFGSSWDAEELDKVVVYFETGGDPAVQK